MSRKTRKKASSASSSRASTFCDCSYVRSLPREDIAQPVADAVRQREYALAVLRVQNLLAHLDLAGGELLLREHLRHHVHQPRELAYGIFSRLSYTP